MSTPDGGGGPAAPIGAEIDPSALRHALGETTDGILIADALRPGFPIVYANRGFERLTGYSEGEVLGSNCRFLQGEDTDPLAVAEMSDALGAARECRVTLLNYGKDGRSFWNDVRLSPVLDGDGRMVQVVGVQHDVSATVEVTAALRDEEESYRVLADALDAGVILIDTDARVLAGNRAAAEMLGIDTRAMVGLSLDDPRGDAVYSDGSPVPHEEHPTIVSLRTGRPLSGVVRGLPRPNGEILWLSVNTRPLWREGESEPYAAIASFTDITDRRRSEAELARRAEIIDQIDAGVVMLDPDGLVTHWNRGAERMYGWSCDEVLGTRVRERVVAPAERSKAAHEFAEVSAGRSYEGEMRLRRRSGEEFSAYLHNVPVYDADGALQGYVGVSVDITEQEQARRALEESREALLESERRLRAVVDGAPMILWALDREGTVVLFEGSLDGLGLGREETVGRSIDVVCAEMQELAEENRRALGGEAFSSTSEAGGRWYETRYSPTHDAAGDVTGVVAVAIDVTERVEAARDREALEARLGQAERLESVGQLAGGIAHDFNNLLAVILNYASFALEDGGEEAAMREDLAEIRRAAERASALTRQLLVFSRRQVAEPTVIRLEEVIEDLGPLLRRTLGEHIRLETAVGGGEHPVRIDHGEVEQVVMNLALNARDAMPTGGTLTIETGSVTPEEAGLRGLPSARYLCLRVRDTGHGMEEGVRTRVFEPFFSTKPRDKGSGLGLATVYGIAQRAEGHLRVDSAPGQGTVVELLLPAAEDASPRSVEAASNGPAARGDATATGAGSHVLLVEDEGAVREVVRRTLTRQGYTVLEACDGREALEMHASHGSAVDLLLTDVVLPEMSGSEVAERIASASPGIRILFMSGYTDDVVLRRGVEQGEVAFLPKPFTPSELLRRVEETLLLPR